MLFIGCVEGRQRPNQAIVSPAFDWGEQTQLDTSVPLDLGLDTSVLIHEREVFIAVDSMQYTLGYRAGLEPQHRARYRLEDMLRMTRSTAFVFVWDGPMGSRDEGLKMAAAQGHRIVPMLVERAGSQSVTWAEVEADIRFLAEWLGTDADAVRTNGRPTIAVDLTGSIAPFQAEIGLLIDRLGLFAMTQVSFGRSPPSWGAVWWYDCRLASSMSASADAAPLRCVTPDLGDADRDNDFARRLVDVRHACDIRGCGILVDGIGRWMDDRQIDPVFGAPTTMPERLTHGRRVSSYGYRRMNDTNRLLADGVVGFSAAAFSESSELIGRASIELDWGPDGLTLDLMPHSESIRMLLNQSPIWLLPGTRCRVAELSDESTLTMRFADGSVHRWTSNADAFEDWVVNDKPQRLEDVLFDAVMKPSGVPIRMSGFKCSIP